MERESLGKEYLPTFESLVLRIRGNTDISGISAVKDEPIDGVYTLGFNDYEKDVLVELLKKYDLSNHKTEVHFWRESPSIGSSLVGTTYICVFDTYKALYSFLVSLLAYSLDTTVSEENRETADRLLSDVMWDFGYDRVQFSSQTTDAYEVKEPYSRISKKPYTRFVLIFYDRAGDSRFEGKLIFDDLKTVGGAINRIKRIKPPSWAYSFKLFQQGLGGSSSYSLVDSGTIKRTR